MTAREGKARRPPVPYPGALLSVLLTATVVLAEGAGGAEPAAVSGGRALAELSLELVNRERRAAGLPALELDAAASRAAVAHADDMLARGYYAHRSPEGRGVLDRVVAAGGSPWSRAAENIAACGNCTRPVGAALVERLHRRWMESPGHRKAILARGMTHFGFGVSSGPPRLAYAVQAFSGPGSDPAFEGRPARELAPESQADLALQLVNRDRENQGVGALDSATTLLEAARGLLGDFGTNPSNRLDTLSARALFDRLPPAEQARWETLRILALACGGCGQHATDGDVAAFMAGWLAQDETRAPLLSDAATHAAFALWASGTGRKVALLAVAERK